MSSYEPIFSPLEFFKNGSSLWRWVKYGHGKSTPFVNPFSRESLTAPCAPHIEKRIKNLICDPKKLPVEFRIRATNFALTAVNFPNNLQAYNYPGDGYLFFTDPIFYGCQLPMSPDITTINFFNYIYSFRHLISPALFFFLSDLFHEKKKTRLYYPYRSLIFGDTSYFDEYKALCNKTRFQKRLEIVFLERIFGHSLINLASKIDIPIFNFLSFVYKLLDGFTHSAVKRILFNSQATRRSVIGAVNLVNDTQNLINNDLPRSFNSIAALKTFHDDQMEYVYRKASEKAMSLQSEFAWDDKLVKIINSECPCWYIPKTPIELIQRGIKHHSCVGAYYQRHFSTPELRDLNEEIYSKTLILFNKEAEAELRLIFKNKNIKYKSTGKSDVKTLCTSCTVTQCRTKYNREYPQDIPDRLCAAFINCDINLFSPLRKK